MCQLCATERETGFTYTTVRVINGVHGNTTSLGPAVTLNSELVLGARSLCSNCQPRILPTISTCLQLGAAFASSSPGAASASRELPIPITGPLVRFGIPRTQHRLVGTATTSNNADHATGDAVHDLLGAGGQLDAGLALIGVVADDGDVVAGGTAESATVADARLDVGDNGTLGHGSQGQDVADGQSSVLAGVDELAGVHALVGDEGLGVGLELVGVAEDNLGEGSATAGIVNDLLDNTTNVSVTLGVVEGSELGGSLVEAGDGSEDRGAALPLVPNNSTHREWLARSVASL